MGVREVRHAERGEDKPLAAVRVVVIEQMQALPYGTQLLAHLGVGVVKVEPPCRSESGRCGRPTIRDEKACEVSAIDLRDNLSKRSAILDLKQEVGRDLFRRAGTE